MFYFTFAQRRDVVSRLKRILVAKVQKVFGLAKKIRRKI